MSARWPPPGTKGPALKKVALAGGLLLASLLLPLALLPAAAAIAWPRPGGPWDKSGLVLRPLAWLLVLYVPLGLGLFVFNVLGWNTRGVVYLSGKVVAFADFTHTALFGRARLAGLATAFALWAQLGAVAAYRHFRRDA